jgi:hypothetical protein
MRQSIAWAAAAVALLLSAAAPAQAAAVHRNVLPEAARAAPDGGRLAQVSVPQAELATNINPSIMTVAMGGGLLGVVIDAKVDNDRAKRAEASITPIRVALGDFDGDQLAIDATRRALEGTDWFGAPADAAPGFGRDASPWGKLAVLDAHAAAGQVAFFDYSYDTSPDFSSIRVGVTITFANTAAPAGAKPDARLAGKNLVYASTVTSVINLPNPGSGQDNAARWAADNGALARRALNLGFEEVAALIPRALTLTEADLTTLSAGERRTLNGVTGKLVQEQSGSVLLFNGGFAHVQVIHE